MLVIEALDTLENLQALLKDEIYINKATTQAIIDACDIAIKSLKMDKTIAEQIHDAYKKGWEDGAKASEEHLKLWLYEKGITDEA